MEKEIGRDPEGMGKKEERKERGRDGGRGEGKKGRGERDGGRKEGVCVCYVCAS